MQKWEHQVFFTRIERLNPFLPEIARPVQFWNSWNVSRPDILFVCHFATWARNLLTGRWQDQYRKIYNTNTNLHTETSPGCQNSGNLVVPYITKLTALEWSCLPRSFLFRVVNTGCSSKNLTAVVRIIWSNGNICHFWAVAAPPPKAANGRAEWCKSKSFNTFLWLFRLVLTCCWYRWFSKLQQFLLTWTAVSHLVPCFTPGMFKGESRLGLKKIVTRCQSRGPHTD